VAGSTFHAPATDIIYVSTTAQTISHSKFNKIVKHNKHNKQGDKQLIGLLMDFLPHLGKVLEETEGEGDAAYLACSSREVVCRKLEMVSQGSENPGEEICADLEEYCEEGDFHEPEAPRVDRQVIEDCLADSKAAQTEGRVADTRCWGALGYQTGAFGAGGRVMYEEFFKLTAKAENNL